MEGRTRWRIRAGVAAIVLTALCAPERAEAQQTIINVPSDGLTPLGKQFVLHESAVVPRKKGESYATTNFYTYGLTPRTELAATLYSIDNGGSPFATLGLGFKSVFEVFRERAPELEGKFTFGTMLPIALQPKRESVGYFTYGSVSFDLFGTDLRLLTGVAVGSQVIWGKDAVSPIMGLEYPFTKHFSFTGEWFEGNHNFSGLIPGFTYHRGGWILVAGFKIPNNFDPNAYGAVLEIGRFFGGKSRKDEEEEEDPGRPIHYGTRWPRRYRRPAGGSE